MNTPPWTILYYYAVNVYIRNLKHISHSFYFHAFFCFCNKILLRSGTTILLCSFVHARNFQHALLHNFIFMQFLFMDNYVLIPRYSYFLKVLHRVILWFLTSPGAARIHRRLSRGSLLPCTFRQDSLTFLILFTLSLLTITMHLIGCLLSFTAPQAFYTVSPSSSLFLEISYC